MSPSLNDQDYIVTLRWPRMNFQPGQIVVVKHPRYQLIVKRIDRISYAEKGSQMLLAGDNPNSTSTEAMGWIQQQQIIGRLVWHVSVSKQPTPKV